MLGDRRIEMFSAPLVNRSSGGYGLPAMGATKQLLNIERISL
jgi:hypothetical protein